VHVLSAFQSFCASIAYHNYNHKMSSIWSDSNSDGGGDVYLNDEPPKGWKNLHILRSYVEGWTKCDAFREFAQNW
jgi:hypothetical protein